MGRDPRATICFSIAYTAEDELPEPDDNNPDEDGIDDVVERYTDRLLDAAVPKPEDYAYERYAADKEYATACDEIQRQRTAWRERYGVYLIKRGSYDHCDGAWTLFVYASKVSVEWDDPLDVSAHLAKFDGLTLVQWNGLLKKCCEGLGLPYRRPTWTMSAFYG